MKKNFILGVFLIGLFVVSFVSAGWFSDFVGKFTSTGNVVSSVGISLDDATLSRGINLSKGSNYWFIWESETISIEEVLGDMKGDVYYIYEKASKTNGKKTSYWYSTPKRGANLLKFTKGEKYRFYMSSNSQLKFGNSNEFHSADYDRDGKISGVELSRVIALMNGANKDYYCNDSTVDGYSNVGGNRNCTQHNADENKDWIISKYELSAVQFLYDCRVNNVRTGEYKNGRTLEAGSDLNNFFRADRCNKDYSCSSGQKIGDLNNDGNINEYDLRLSTQAVLGLISFKDICCADMNKDNKLDATDIQFTNLVARGEEASPGICGGNGSSYSEGGSSVSNFSNIGKIEVETITSPKNSQKNLTLLSDSGKIVIGDTMVFRDHTGNGNAYACFKSDGKLFRSETPCR